MFKGYPCFKTITSQNVSPEVQVKIFFYFIEKLCFVLKIMKFLYSKWSHDLPNLWRHDQGAFLNISFEPQLNWPIDRYKQGQRFFGMFRTIWKTRAKLQVPFNLGTCSNYSITNYVNISVFHFFENVKKGQFKMVNIHY